MKLSAQKGISLIEIVIVVFVATVLLFSITQVAALAVRISSEKKVELRGIYYAQEGMEALRAMRDESWNTRISGLTASTTYYFAPSANSWTLTTTNPGALDGIFTRTVVMQGVNRGANSDIAASGTNDPDTKKFTVLVSWNTQAATRLISTDTYLANLYKN